MRQAGRESRGDDTPSKLEEECGGGGLHLLIDFFIWFLHPPYRVGSDPL